MAGAEQDARATVADRLGPGDIRADQVALNQIHWRLPKLFCRPSISMPFSVLPMISYWRWLAPPSGSVGSGCGGWDGELLIL